VGIGSEELAASVFRAYGGINTLFQNVDGVPTYQTTRRLIPDLLNPLTPNDPYRGRTAPLTSKRCILYIYSTNIDTEYFKHGIYSQFFPLKNAVCFIFLTYLAPVLFAFYMQVVLKLKKNSGAKRLIFIPS